ncbi:MULTISPECIES: hypothetical protein [Porphyromonas]|uniref:hypothetical protein n=1 Tax=Porphyromonas TaxID=836 RepID=UPI000562C2C0|nr:MULTISPECIES: hypothetical protein [Porphyromonas]
MWQIRIALSLFFFVPWQSFLEQVWRFLLSGLQVVPNGLRTGSQGSLFGNQGSIFGSQALIFKIQAPTWKS